MESCDEEKARKVRESPRETQGSLHANLCSQRRTGVSCTSQSSPSRRRKDSRSPDSYSGALSNLSPQAIPLGLTALGIFFDFQYILLIILRSKTGGRHVATTSESPCTIQILDRTRGWKIPQVPLRKREKSLLSMTRFHARPNGSCLNHYSSLWSLYGLWDFFIAQKNLENSRGFNISLTRI